MYSSSSESEDSIDTITHQNALRDTIRQKVQRNVKETNDKPDKTYVQNWNKFKKWVEEKHAKNVLLAGDKYITRDNVDLYFSDVVAYNKKVLPDTAKK